MKDQKQLPKMKISVIRASTRTHLSIENYGRSLKRICLARKRRRRRKMGKRNEYLNLFILIIFFISIK